MKNFKARYIVEREIRFQAESVAAAEQELTSVLRTTKETTRILGIIPADQNWPDSEPAKRPPRNSPPSGSPGTPTVDAQPELAQAVAA